MLEKEQSQASRLRADGRVELTGATDENGILVELSAYDIERLPREEIDRYQERRRKQIETKTAEAAEAAALERFTAAFVAAGGKKSDAPAAFTAHRNQQAAEAAARADNEALVAGRRRIQGVL
jgi:hypothetical protein